MTSKAPRIQGIMAAGQPQVCARMEGLPNEALVQVAAYFQALSEPTRLQILNLLRTQARRDRKSVV